MSPVLMKALHTVLEHIVCLLKEHQENESNLVVEDADKSQVVNLYGCKNTTVVVKGKVNAVTMGVFCHLVRVDKRSPSSHLCSELQEDFYPCRICHLLNSSDRFSFLCTPNHWHSPDHSARFHRFWSNLFVESMSWRRDNDCEVQ